ncbi:tRNA (adenosine(37)-N6)-dimethylallyltransferase MiaA [Pseudonocardia sp. N23]|uniref:tRNA (adenosine(37)-N6)-dimethylallyltransferase MiaA n=1 Tax=Pseudonocardia sp. N23 TaxID=1987376 RepID=UPI000BFD351C|nr:tRNA (adenosine(37)-N6)-dimethylallyltransferase MiaA [Pseudonocardia sp. N23]GAY11917.1 tRNA dimethylallyltransferase [Pseudonocardia sp. N23]
MSAPPLVVVVGPTATGKSDLGLALAEQLGGEVVNADAMQLYRGLDVGTAKLTVAERRGIPHHLLDVLDVTDTASVAAYQREARAVVERLRAAGRTPVLVGGSGLYVQAVVDELEFPGTDPAIRSRIEAELVERGSGALHLRLAELDPAAAAAVLPSNGRRIVRALEVIELTGRPFTATMPRIGAPRYDAVLVGVDRDVAELDARIATRVDLMMAAGLVDETRALLGRGLREGRTASRALGYQQVIDALDAADGDLADVAVADAADRTVVATRRFVRRQRSWFRRDHRIRWFDGAAPDLIGAVAASLPCRV